MKTYRRHNCNALHRSYVTLAKCIWRYRMSFLGGSGPYASVAYCARRERGMSVQLHDTEARALAAKKTIDASGCGGLCCRDHDVVRLELPGQG